MDTSARLSELTAAHGDRVAANDLMRFLSAKTDTHGGHLMALKVFEERWPTAPFATNIRLERKAAVLPGSTTDAAWAGNLVAPSAGPLLALVQQESLLGRVPFSRVPFNAKVPTQSSLGTFGWIPEGGSKPVTKIDFTSTTLPLGKAAGIIVLTAELVKLAVPGSEDVMRRALTGGLASFLDKQLVDASIAAVAGKNPASLSNGVVPITPTGTTLAAKVSEVLAALYAGRPTTQRAVLIATPAVVSALAGSAPGLTVVANQNHYAGVPIYGSPHAGSLVIAADAAGVLVASGELTVDVSGEGLVEMVDNPGAPTAATIYVSLWQTDMRGFLVEQAVWWSKLPNAVQTVAA